MLLLACSISALDEYTTANAKVHRMKNHLLNQKKTHPLINDYAMCRKEEGNLEAALNNAKAKLQALEQNKKKSELAVSLQEKYIESLKKAILEAQAKHERESAPKIKELKEQLELIKKIIALADNLVKQNPKRKETMDRLKALLEKMAGEFNKLLEDLKISPEVQLLKHKLATAMKVLAQKQAQVKRDQAAIDAMKKTIQDLVDQLNKKAGECGDIKVKLNDALAKIDKMIALFEKVLGMLKKISDGSGASGSATEAVDKDAVKKLLESILAKLKAALAALKDPAPKCKADEADLRKKIDAKGDLEKKLAAEIEALKKRIADAEAALAKLLAEAGALEGKLAILNKECKALGDAIGRDAALDAELKAIAEILALIHKLEGEKKLDQVTGDKMENIIKRLRDSIIAAIEKKLKEQTDAYNACKARRDATEAAWKAKHSEAQQAKSALDDLKSKLANLEQQLGAARVERKALLDLLSSLMARCSAAQAAYAKNKAEFDEEIKVLTQVIDML